MTWESVIFTRDATVFDKKKTGNLEQCTIGTLWLNFNWLNQIIKRKGPFILCLYFVSGLQLAICSRHFLLINRSFYRLFRNSYLRCIIKHGLTSNLTCVFKQERKRIRLTWKKRRNSKARTTIVNVQGAKYVHVIIIIDLTFVTSKSLSVVYDS